LRTRFGQHARFPGFGTCLVAFVLVLGTIDATSIGLQCQIAHAQLMTSIPSLPPMNLAVIGLSGTQVVLNSTDIASLPSVRGLGGAGTLDNGNLTTLPHSQPLTLIIAYYKNDVNLTTQGPLMSAIIGPEGLLTDGHYWVWYATEIQVLNAGAVPEFQPFSLTLFLMIAAFAAAVLSKKHSTSPKIRLHPFSSVNLYDYDNAYYCDFLIQKNTRRRSMSLLTSIGKKGNCARDFSTGR
jgi:hypothetical protein